MSRGSAVRLRNCNLISHAFATGSIPFPQFELNRTQPFIMVLLLMLNVVTATAVVGNVVADPARARAAASLEGGRGESNTQPTWLFGQEKRPFEEDALLVATTVRASQHDAGAIVPNARVAHGHATAAQEQARHRDECKLRGHTLTPASLTAP